MGNFRMILDMDEVMVDFVGGALRAHGWTRKRLYAAWPPGEWDMAAPMGLTLEEFWAPLTAAGENFWTGLEPHPWLPRLLALVEGLTKDWYIVSSPSQCSSCHAGKARWLKTRFGPHFDRFAITPHKHLFANPDTLLIDDRDETVRRFTDYGGVGLVFPARHNRLHRLADDPVRYLETVLKKEVVALGSI